MTTKIYKEYELLLTQHEAIRAEKEILLKEYALLEKELKSKEKLETELKEKDLEIETLKKEVLRLNGYLNIDGTNSGIPTSKTPISKKKIIPNSRKRSGKKIGGQPGHAKSKLKAFEDKEVTQIQIHKTDECPVCLTFIYFIILIIQMDRVNI